MGKLKDIISYVIPCLSNMSFLSNSRLDEIALLDLPAMFHTVLSYSPADSKIIFIGHSLGSTFSLMYASEYPEYSKRVLKIQVFLCPAYTLTNMISPFKAAAPFVDFFLVIIYFLLYFEDF